MFPRLKERESQKAGTLSGGEQQMLAMGRALMSNPRLLLLDEPSLGLAPLVVHTIFEAIDEIKSKGTTILLVEQNAHAALEHSDAHTCWKLEESLWKVHRKIWPPTPGSKKLISVSRPALLPTVIRLLFRQQTSLRLPRLVAPAALLLLSLAFSCARAPDSTKPDHTVIKIGYFGDLSGPTFNFGQSAINGVLMAAEEINQVGGINGRRLDVVIDDDGGSPEKAATLAARN